MPDIYQLFDALIDRKGSDLHLSVGYPPMFRVRGDLEPYGKTALDKPAVETLLYEILDVSRKEQFVDAGDLDFAYAYQDKARFRANYLMKTTGPGEVSR